MENRVPIVGYEGSYEVSDLGNVKSLARGVKCKNGRMLPIHGRTLKPRKTGNSTHYRVTLQKTDGKFYRYTVHRLVYCTFNKLDIAKNTDGNYVLHKNDICRDNRLDNLYMGTHSDNMNDRYRNSKNKAITLLK